MTGCAFYLLFLVVLALTLPRTCAGSVILKTGNLTYDALADMPADFGPRIPAEGLRGLLMVADPEDACESQRLSPLGAPWVALVARSQEKLKNCTFDVKVRNVEAAGAIAAIIYDDMYEPLIIMSKPLDHPDPGIPAVFVSQRSGVMLKRLMTPGLTTVEITPISDAVWLSMLMSAFAGFLAMSVVMGTFFFIRHQRLGLAGAGAGAGGGGYGLGRPAPRTMTPEQIRALPVEVYEEHAGHAGHAASDQLLPHPGRQLEQAVGGASGEGRESGGTGCDGGGIEAGAAEEGGSSGDGSAHPGRKGGGTRTTCAICLENYVEGDKLRVLPCQHRYHLECIDQWLSRRKALCPACRHDATERDVEAGGGAAAEERESALRRAWAFLGGRWLQWRMRNPPAARLARRLVINALEERQQLIAPGGGEIAPGGEQRQQGQAQEGPAAWAAAAGQGSPRADAGSSPRVYAGGPRPAGSSSPGISVSRNGSQATEEEITPLPEGRTSELEPPSRRASPRAPRFSAQVAPAVAAERGPGAAETRVAITGRLSPSSAASQAESSGSSAGSSRASAQLGRQQAASGVWLVESRADSSTDGSEAP